MSDIVLTESQRKDIESCLTLVDDIEQACYNLFVWYNHALKYGYYDMATYTAIGETLHIMHRRIERLDLNNLNFGEAMHIEDTEEEE